MFNPTQIVIDAFLETLCEAYHATYTNLEPSYPGIISFTAQMALELIANSDAPYHDLNHTINVTLVGQEILRGKHLREGGVSPRDWLHFIVSLLCHDIGYVRGICRNDNNANGKYVINFDQKAISLEPGATDAALTPYHVERGKLFIQERFAENPVIDVGVVCDNIEYTKFPVPERHEKKIDQEYPSLLRAADLIGQLADPNYMRKISSLFVEFQETGTNEFLGYKTAADLRAAYPAFYWTMVQPYVSDGLRYLQMTQNGKQWVANLYAHIFAEEHALPGLGVERRD